MTPYLLYIKAGIALAIILGLVTTGFHFGRAAGRAEVARLESESAQAVATAVLAQRAATQKETDRLQRVLQSYEQAFLTPVDPGIAHRVYVYSQAHCPALPKSTSNTGGTIPPGPVTGGFEDALQGYINACDRDAKRLNSLIEAWPR